MTRDETKNILNIIMRAYPRMRIVETKEDVDLWHECLSDLDYGKARVAAINLVKTAKDFPPDIATIREEYERLVGIENHEIGEIKRFFQQARAYYPGSGEMWNGFEVWQSRATNAKDAEIFYKVVTQYVNECDRNGQDCMDFVECLRTITRDCDGRISFKAR